MLSGQRKLNPQTVVFGFRKLENRLVTNLTLTSELPPQITHGVFESEGITQWAVEILVEDWLNTGKSETKRVVQTLPFSSVSGANEAAQLILQNFRHPQSPYSGAKLQILGVRLQ